MGKDLESVRITAKLIIASNHEPTVADNSHAFWRRLIKVAFGVAIPTAEIDPHLERTIRAEELPGILNWALQGLQIYQAEGIIKPVAIRQASEAYRTSEDSILHWVKERVCDAPTSFVPTIELFSAYQAFCMTEGLRYEPQGAFTKALPLKFDAAFGEAKRDKKSPNRGYRVSLRSRDEPPPVPQG